MMWSVVVTLIYTTILIGLGFTAYVMYLRRPEEFDELSITRYIWRQHQLFAEIYVFLHVLFTYLAIFLFLYLTISIFRLVQQVRSDIVSEIYNKENRLTSIISLIDDPYIREKISSTINY